MRTLRRRAPLLCAVLLAGCSIAACGSSTSTASKSTTTSAAAASGGGGGATGRFSAFRKCLQQHGVTLPQRRPRSGRPPGGGFFGGGAGGGEGLAARDPKLAGAIQACGGFRGPRRFQLSRTAINKYVACVRQHGYNLPKANFSGRGPVFPANIRTDPKFQAASRACQNLLIRPRTGTTTTARS
jgi:hypothetical protein